MTDGTQTVERGAAGKGAAVAAPEPSTAPPAASNNPPGRLVAAGASPPSTAFPAAPEPDEIDVIVDRWFSVTFPGSPVAQTTEQWNFLHSAKEELKKLLPR